MESARFEIGDLLGIGMTLVVLGIGLSYGLDILADQQTELIGSADAQTAVNDTITGIAKLPEKLPTIVTVIVAAVIIGILVRYLWRGAVGGQ